MWNNLSYNNRMFVITRTSPGCEGHCPRGQCQSGELWSVWIWTGNSRAATTKQLQDDFRSFNWWRWMVGASNPLLSCCTFLDSSCRCWTKRTSWFFPLKGLSPPSAVAASCSSAEGSGRLTSRGRWRSSRWAAGHQPRLSCDTGTSSGHVTPRAGVWLRLDASQTPARRRRCPGASPAGRGGSATGAACWTCSWAPWEN